MMEGGARARETLLNRYVPLIDEVAEFMEQSGQRSLASILDDLRKDFADQPHLGEGARQAVEQEAIREAIFEYEAQAELAAAAARAHRTAVPSAVRKLYFGGRGDDLLAAFEPDLSGVVKCAPEVSSLALRVLMPHATHKYPGGAFIAGTDGNILVMYIGHYRPCISSAGFYLVYDTLGNSLAAVPQLPSFYVSWFSHINIGSMAAVLLHTPPADYVIAELLLRKDTGILTPESVATLYLWWSSGPAEHRRRWIRKEVFLPLLPYSHEQQGYAFCADTVFSVGRCVLCWVDLLVGILACNVCEPDPVLVFIPLPEGYYKGIDSVHGRRLPEEYRAMSRVTSLNQPDDTVKFVSMDECCEGDIFVTTWSLNFFKSEYKWTRIESFRMSAVVPPAMPPLRARRPLISEVEPDVIYFMAQVKGQQQGYLAIVRKGRLEELVPQSGSAANVFVTPFFGMSSDNFNMNKLRLPHLSQVASTPDSSIDNYSSTDNTLVPFPNTTKI